MSSAYEFARIVLIRMAGAPFDLLERLGTPRSVLLARNGSGATEIADTLEEELNAAREVLITEAKKLLPRLLIFGGSGVRELLAHLERRPLGRPAHRNAKAGDRERHMLLYLQRICSKNDTFSEFGPSGWGRVTANASGLCIAPQPGIARRDAFLERWTAHALAAAINSDAEVAKKIAVPALNAHPVDVMLADVEQWRDGAARDRWLPVLQSVNALPAEFALTTDTDERRSLLDAARFHLQSLGAERRAGERFLYAATNPIGEECFRECNFEIGEKLIDEVVTEAEPWIDLWRDSYAFVASRVSAGLRRVMEKAGAGEGRVPLPVFLQACEAAQLPLQTQGLVALAVIAFQEVKAAVRERLQPHADLAEYELTPEDCHVVRDSFEYPRFDEFTYPSADLQLAAESTEAVARGDYRWLLAELHPPPALLHHCMYWACPDKPALNHAMEQVAGGKPGVHFGFFAADFTGHTAVRVFDALPRLMNFVAAQRPDPHWQQVPPDQVEVFVDPENGDVGLRRMKDHQYLGSFARGWVIPLGFHPFQFSLSGNTPRLRCGRVIVQRRSWTVTLEEFPSGKYHGVSAPLLVAVEKIRAERGLPRHIYIRPTEAALRRSGAEGRDKDTKPVYIDLESYFFQEIFYRWLSKAGEIEITEMLPAPEELLWQEADGRRTFELRTLIVPRQ